MVGVPENTGRGSTYERAQGLREIYASADPVAGRGLRNRLGFS